jgi:S-DNA-T family DNA segregation ATPase FtsK/SpoIIIE
MIRRASLFTPMPEVQQQQPAQQYQQPAPPAASTCAPSRPPQCRSSLPAAALQRNSRFRSSSSAAQPQESLIHPLLMRNGDSRPLQKPTTPLPSLDLLTPPPS